MDPASPFGTQHSFAGTAHSVPQLTKPGLQGAPPTGPPGHDAAEPLDADDPAVVPDVPSVALFGPEDDGGELPIGVPTVETMVPIIVVTAPLVETLPPLVVAWLAPVVPVPPASVLPPVLGVELLEQWTRSAPARNAAGGE
jgi:hypothetical protein